MKLTVLGVDASPRYPGFIVANVDTKAPIKSFHPLAWKCLRSLDLGLGADMKRPLSLPKVETLAEIGYAWCVDNLRRVNHPGQRVACFEQMHPGKAKTGGLHFVSYVAMLYSKIYQEFSGDIVLVNPVSARRYLAKQLLDRHKALSKAENVKLVDSMYRKSSLKHPVPEGPGDLSNSQSSVGYLKYEAIVDATAVAIKAAEMVSGLSPQYWYTGKPRKPLSVVFNGK